VGGNTYYWSVRSDDSHSQGVAVAVSNKLTPMIIEVTPVKERIMRQMIHHSLGVISLVSDYAPTEASDLTVKDAFHATLESVVDQCPRRDTLLVLGDFNASTGTDRNGYETCVGHHGSGTVNLNSTNFLDFARSHGLRVAGSWFQRPQAHHWTWYSNDGGVAKEIDHVVVDGCWRMIQNYRVYWSAQFLNTDHRLFVTTVKLHLKSSRMVPSQPWLDVGKLKDERLAVEFANRLSGDLGGLGALGGPEGLWSAFKTTVLDVVGGCLGTHGRAKKNFVSQETLDAIDQSCRARLNGRAELFRLLRRKTVHALRVDKEAYVRGICEGESITCGQVILVLLTEEFAHCIHLSPSHGVLQWEQRVVGS